MNWNFALPSCYNFNFGRTRKLVGYLRCSYFSTLKLKQSYKFGALRQSSDSISLIMDRETEAVWIIVTCTESPISSDCIGRSQRVHMGYLIYTVLYRRSQVRCRSLDLSLNHSKLKTKNWPAAVQSNTDRHLDRQIVYILVSLGPRTHGIVKQMETDTV